MLFPTPWLKCSTPVTFLILIFSCIFIDHFCIVTSYFYFFKQVIISLRTRTICFTFYVYDSIINFSNLYIVSIWYVVVRNDIMPLCCFIVHDVHLQIHKNILQLNREATVANKNVSLVLREIRNLFTDKNWGNQNSSLGKSLNTLLSQLLLEVARWWT